jgi:hypothetical protein
MMILAVSVGIAVSAIGGDGQAMNTAQFPVLLIVGALYLLGPVCGISGIVLGIKGLFGQQRLKAFAAIAVNGVLLIGVGLPFAFSLLFTLGGT